MSVLNQFTKNLTGFQSALETEKRLHAVDPASTALTLQTRSRRIGIETYTYSGGSKDAAIALRHELEAIAGMGEVYGCSDNSMDPNAPWTVTASQTITTDWGDWL